MVVHKHVVFKTYLSIPKKKGKSEAHMICKREKKMM